MAKATAAAHGRVNLIGEHTDYNLGFVLPALIPQETAVSIETNGSREVRVDSASLGLCVYELGREEKSGHWADYVKGVTKLCAAAGHRVDGFDIRIQSNVPVGSGLSSSAALCVAIFRGLKTVFDAEISDIEIAKLCQRVENEFVGARVGIMDPLACGLAKPGFALFVDTRSLESRHVPLPGSCELVVINSGVSHENAAAGGYNERRAQCDQVRNILDVPSLRDITARDLGLCAQKLPDILFRRVRHVVTENDRVVEAVAALERSDLAALGALFDASHASLRDDYEVSVPEVDTLVEITRSQHDVYGARITGGGFGGSIVALAKKGRAADAAEAAAETYEKQTGLAPCVLVP